MKGRGARDGRCAAPEHLKAFGSGNIVDVPALQWLARQPAPRVWISDGLVTGMSDTASTEIQRRCKEIRRRAGILRVKTADAAALLLESRAARRRLEGK